MNRILCIGILLFSQALLAQDHALYDQIQDKMSSVLIHKGKRPVNNFMLYLDHGTKDFTFHKGVGTLTPKGDSIDENYQYNIASITKTVVAAVILQLQEEGKLQLTDPIGQYLSQIPYLRFEELHLFEGKSYAQEIQVLHLLRHQSGLGDIFLDTQTRFNLSVLFHKKRMYSPKRIMDTFFKYKLNKKTHFKPGEGSYYTDINYLLLGLIIEEITGESLPQQIRKRILEPLGMEQTYFEFYEEHRESPKRIIAFLNRIQITRKINTSYEWGGGGLVSTTREMGLFIQGLFEGKILKNPESLKQMIDMSSNKPYHHYYGLGIYQFTFAEQIYYGHGGFYGSILLYQPEKKITLSANINQANAPFDVTQVLTEILTLADGGSKEPTGK